MTVKRPCRVCRRWFSPSPRSKGRQHTCSSEDCQRERHRRACAEWHEGNPDYDRERRLRERIRVRSTVGDTIDRDPLAEVSWGAARDASNLETAVIVEETARVLVDWARDSFRAQVLGITKQTSRVAPRRARDALGAECRPP